MDHSFIAPATREILIAKASILLTQPKELAIIIVGFLLVFIILRSVAKTLSFFFKLILALVIAALIASWFLYRTPIIF